MSSIARLFIVICIPVVLGGCFGRIQPVYTASHPIGASAQALSLDEISDAIVRGASKRQWVVEDQGPGKMMATYQNSKHSATVEITYSKTRYTITYHNSNNLLYDKGNTASGKVTIHRTYNRWVANLEKDIGMEIQAAGIKARQH